jgi:trehalose 6-phosphate synthase
VQIGAPSRTEIPAYRNLLGEVAAEAERINARFQAGRWKPIVLLKKHHGHRDINRLYRAADVCLVSSLHDGMNLVAKEFVAARHDERGVLILSKFAGAARELLDALIVNPYDIRQFAEAIRAAVQMPSAEQEARMRRMRRVVREQNIYRWAGNLLSDLCEIRLDSSERPRKAPLLVLPARAGAL